MAESFRLKKMVQRSKNDSSFSSIVTQLDFRCFFFQIYTLQDDTLQLIYLSVSLNLS